jgi:hypothetical protein
VVEKAHPAIISEEECDAVNAMARKPLGMRPSEKPKSRWLLSSGAQRCARCGSKYAGKKTDSDYYLCGSHIYRRGAGCGPGWYVRKDELEELVFQKLLDHVRKGDVADWVAVVNAHRDAR